MTFYDIAIVLLIAISIGLWRAFVVANREIEKLRRELDLIEPITRETANTLSQLAVLTRDSIANVHRMVNDDHERLEKFAAANSEFIKKILELNVGGNRDDGDEKKKEFAS